MAAALDSAVAAVAASNSLDPDALRRLRWRHPTLLRRFHSTLTEKRSNSKDNSQDNIEDNTRDNEDKDIVYNAQKMAASGDKKINAVDGQIKGVEGEGGGGGRKEDEGGGGGTGAGDTGEKKEGEEKPEKNAERVKDLTKNAYKKGDESGAGKDASEKKDAGGSSRSGSAKSTGASSAKSAGSSGSKSTGAASAKSASADSAKSPAAKTADASKTAGEGGKEKQSSEKGKEMSQPEEDDFLS